MAPYRSVSVDTAVIDRFHCSELDDGDDIAKAREVIIGALHGVHGVIAKPAPEPLVVDLAGSSVNIRARWWINPPRRADVVASLDQALEAIRNALTAEGIDLPFPTRQVLFHDQTETTDGDRARQREGWPTGRGEAPGSRSIADAPLRRSGRGGGG